MWLITINVHGGMAERTYAGTRVQLCGNCELLLAPVGAAPVSGYEFSAYDDEFEVEY